MSKTTVPILSWLLLCLMPLGPAHADSIKAIDIKGTSIQVLLASGRELGTKDLIGAVLNVDLPGVGKRRIKIDNIIPDAADKDGDVLLYAVRILDKSTGKWKDYCDPGPDGRRLAIPLKGKWDATGHRYSDTGITFTCTAGAIGKCVRLGYKPWKVTKNGVSLLDYHQACVHLIRADYCGNGSATTRNGTHLDIFDNLGIQRIDKRDRMSFEAAWNKNGAVCVAHTRIPANMTLHRLSRTCPRLVGHLGEKNCSGASQGGNAILFDRSYKHGG